MTISIVGAGSLVQSASGTTIAFGSGWTTNDLHLVFTSLKNTAANEVPATPVGYTDIVTQTFSGRVIAKLCGRLLQPGDTAPTVNGGGNSLLIGGLTLRGTRSDSVGNAVEVATVATNTSASAIGYTAAAVATAGCMAALWGLYNTSGAGTLGTPTTLSGGAANTVGTYTGGSLKGTLWTDLQTNAVDISAGSIPITGGSSQTNRSLLVVIRPQPSASVTISSVSDATFYNGQTGIVATGTGYGASDATGKICFTDDVTDVAAVAQTKTSQSTTTFEFTAVRGAFDAFEQGFLFITNGSGQSNASGYPVKFSARMRINDDIEVNDAPAANVTGIQYLVVPTDDITAAPLLEGTTESTDGSAQLVTDYYELVEGGPISDGDDIVIVLYKDATPKENSWGTTLRYSPDFS